PFSSNHCSSTTAAYPPWVKASFAKVCPSNFPPFRAQKTSPRFRARESVHRRTVLAARCLPRTSDPSMAAISESLSSTRPPLSGPGPDFLLVAEMPFFLADNLVILVPLARDEQAVPFAQGIEGRADGFLAIRDDGDPGTIGNAGQHLGDDGVGIVGAGIVAGQKRPVGRLT